MAAPAVTLSLSLSWERACVRRWLMTSALKDAPRTRRGHTSGTSLRHKPGWFVYNNISVYGRLVSCILYVFQYVYSYTYMFVCVCIRAYMCVCVYVSTSRSNTVWYDTIVVGKFCVRGPRPDRRSSLTMSRILQKAVFVYSLYWRPNQKNEATLNIIC